AAGKADTGFAGLYHTSTSHHYSGDITDLQLDAGTYVRARASHSYCSELAPETDQYDLVTTSSGHSYLRFWTVDIVDHGSGLDSSARLADVYEIRAISHGIQLRKTY